MTKWIVAAGMMITAALATGTTQSAQSAQPAQTDSTEEIATGTCSYTCSSNGKTYINRTRCLAACSGTCVVEAC